MIPDNIISTTEGQQQTTIPTTKNAQPQCPTNPLYGLMDGRCVYFEKTSLTFDKATQNCQEKLKDYGGGILYEPNSNAEQKRIVDMAYERLSGQWFWIGVTDKTTEGQFSYNSNNQPISFTPDWYRVTSPSGYRGRSNNCIMILVTSPSGNRYSEWYDQYCTGTHIAQSVGPSVKNDPATSKFKICN